MISKLYCRFLLAFGILKESVFHSRLSLQRSLLGILLQAFPIARKFTGSLSYLCDVYFVTFGEESQ